MRVELPVSHPFDYQLAMDRLAAYRAPRNKLRNLCLGGEVLRVKKGLYVAAPLAGRAPAVNPAGFGCAHLRAFLRVTGNGARPSRADPRARLRDYQCHLQACEAVSHAAGAVSAIAR